MLEDKLLVWKLKRGDGGALRRIYEKYKDELLTIAVLLLNETGAAEDIVGDVFVSFAGGIGGFGLYRNLRSYFVSRVVGRVREKFESKMYEVVELDRSRAGILDSEQPDQSVTEAEQSQLLADVLAQLRYHQREVIILHLQGAMRLGQIAASQGASISTVHSRYRYGLERLTELLGAEVASSAEAIEESIRKLRLNTTAETDERILDDALAALGEPEQPRTEAESLSLWRTILKNRTARLSAVAVIIITALIVVEVFKGPDEKPKEIVKQIEVAKTESVVETATKAEPASQIKPKAQQDVEKLNAKLKKIDQLFATGDIDGLIAMLSERPLKVRVVAAVYLAKIGDLRAVEALEKLSAEGSKDEAGDLFATIASQLKSRLEKEKQQAEIEIVAQSALPVRVHIVDKQSGEDIAEQAIQVTLKDLQNAGAVVQDVTDDQGRCVVVLARGQYTLLAQDWRDGKVHEFSKDFVVGPDSNGLDIEIAITPWPIIYGWLVDANDKPVRGIVKLSQQEAVTTDQQGEFEIPQPQAEPNAVHIGWAFDVKKELGRAFYRQGSDEPNDLEIVVEPLAIITGWVVDVNGTGIGDAKAELLFGPLSGDRLAGSAAAPSAVKMEADGRFRFEAVPVGLPLQVIVERDGFQSKEAIVEGLKAGQTADVGDIMLESLREAQQRIERDVNSLGRITEEPPTENIADGI